jgi:hypothetical protein
MFRAAAIVGAFVLACAMAAFSQVASNTAAQRAARIIPGLPTPPAATHWLTPPPIVVDMIRTQTIAIVTVSLVSSGECLKVIYHKAGAWRTNLLELNPPVITSITTNIFSITNGPVVP